MSASGRVGWAWIVRTISSVVGSRRKATHASAIRSVAWGPTMWTPRSSSYRASETTFTRPSGWTRMRGLARLPKLKRPMRTSWPRFFASAPPPPPPHREKEHVGGDGLRLAGRGAEAHLDPVRGPQRGLGAGPGVNGHLLGEGLPGLGRDLLVFQGEDAGQHLDNGDRG